VPKIEETGREGTTKAQRGLLQNWRGSAELSSFCHSLIFSPSSPTSSTLPQHTRIVEDDEGDALSPLRCSTSKMLTNVAYEAFVGPKDSAETLPLLRNGVTHGIEPGISVSEVGSEAGSNVARYHPIDRVGGPPSPIPSPSSPARSASQSPPARFHASPRLGSSSSSGASSPPTPIPSLNLGLGLGLAGPSQLQLAAFQDASASAYQPLAALISRLVRTYVLNPPQTNIFPEEPTFVDAFLLCYRRFCTPRDVCLGLTLKLREVDKVADDQDPSPFGSSYKHFVRLR
jgi:hypothetical protein